MSTDLSADTVAMTKDEIVDLVADALGELAAMTDDQSGTSVNYQRAAEAAVETLLAAGLLQIDGKVSG